MLALGLAVFLIAAAGRPLVYWGARPPVVIAPVEHGLGTAAQVEEVSALLDHGSLVVRFAFDRPVRAALYLEDGAPVSGRLQAAVYLDADDDRRTGLDEGALDLRTGADYRLEVGVVALGEDKSEHLPAHALVAATLVSFDAGRRRTIWRADDSAQPDAVSVYGEWLDVRLPAGTVPIKNGARIILAAGGRLSDGRFRAEGPEPPSGR